MDINLDAFKIRRFDANDLRRGQEKIRARKEEESEWNKNHQLSEGAESEETELPELTDVYIRCVWERVDPSLFTMWARDNGLKVKTKSRCFDLVKVDFEHSNAETFEELHKGFTLLNRGDNGYDDYVFLFRSTGAAKNGSSIFVRKAKLAKKFKTFLNMNTPIVRNSKIDLTSRNAYMSLIASSVQDVIRIHPHQILIVDDVDYKTRGNSIVVYPDENGVLRSSIEESDIDSSLFDGEGLIQYDMDGVKDHDGFVLLRQHYTKCCAFKCDIQAFMREAFGIKGYDTAQVTDCFGVVLNARDIRLIMCKSSIKWIKYNDEFSTKNYMAWEKWHDSVIQLDSMWGVVKSGHDSKFKSLGECNYQILNSINPSRINKLLDTSIDYLENFCNPENLKFTLGVRGNDYNNYELILGMINANPELQYTEFLDRRIKDFYYDCRDKIKYGRPLLHAHYLTICGNPIALLRHSVGLEPIDDFTEEPNIIQCYCPRFEEEYLGGARSPHNSRNNLVALHNVKLPELEKYMHIGNNVIVVNQRSSFQPRTNGSDEDGDTLFTCSDYDFVEDCKLAMKEDMVVINTVSNSKKLQEYNEKGQANLDYAIHRSQGDIGSSSNLSQISQTMYWNTMDRKYYDYCAILAVVAQIAIDSGKKSFDCDVKATIREIKKCLPNEWFYWWNKVTESNRKNTDRDDNNSPISILFKTRLPRYRSANVNIINDYTCFIPKSIDKKTAENVRDFVNTQLMDGMQFRRLERMSYAREDTKHSSVDSIESARERLAEQFDEGLYGERGVVTVLSKRFARYQNLPECIQYMFYYIIVERKDIEERDKADLLWLIYKSVPEEAFREAMQFKKREK